MNKAILAVVSLTCLLLIIDLFRAREPIVELRDDVLRLEQNIDHLVRQQSRTDEELRALVRALEGGVVLAEGGGSRPSASERDGIPVEGREFLLPYDADHLDRDLVGGELKFFDDEPISFNSTIQSMAGTGDVNRLVNDLLCIHPTDDPERWMSHLATSCIISDDFTTFTFEIRRGVQWQVPTIARQEGYEWLAEPVELTAHDFVFQLDMYLDPTVESGHAKPYFKDIDSYQAIDDHTLVIRWKESLVSNIDTSLSLGPLPRHVYTRNADGSPTADDLIPVTFNDHWFDNAMQIIGVGRYRLEEFASGRHLLFRRSPSYWGMADHFETIRWDTSVRERDSQLPAFKNNQVHYYGLAPNQWKSQIIDGQEPRFEARESEDDRSGYGGEFGWARVQSNTWSCVAWNLRRPHLADVRVRQALAHVFPSERIIEDVFFGLGRPKAGPVHPDHPLYNHDLELFDYDVAAAEALLEEAGWTDTDGDGWRDKVIDGERRQLRVEITYYGIAKTWQNLVSLYADQARAAGIEIVPSPVETKEWERRAQDRDFDGFILYWRSTDLSLDFQQLWHSDGANDSSSSNYPGYANDEIDELSEEFRRAFDFDEQRRIAHRVQAILQRDQPYLFMTSGESVLIWHNRRSGENDDREVLHGVQWGLEHRHPLFNRGILWRDGSPWHFLSASAE